MTDGAAASWEPSATADGDAGADDDPDKERQLGAITRATGFGWLGFGMIILWGLPLSLLFAPLLLLGLSEPVLNQVASTVALGFGTATGAAAYLWVSDRGLDFIDVELPSLRDVGYALAGVVGLFAALFAINLLIEQLGIPSSDHGIVEQAKDAPQILLVLAPLSLLIVGPGEELLYRNVVQKSLYETFSRRGAIFIASVIFASVHVLAYGGGVAPPLALLAGILAAIPFVALLGMLYLRAGDSSGPAVAYGLLALLIAVGIFVSVLVTGFSVSIGGVQSVLVSLGLVFVLSLVLGGIYARTENLVVPAVVHGVFNAVQFLLLYFEV